MFQHKTSFVVEYFWDCASVRAKVLTSRVKDASFLTQVVRIENNLSRKASAALSGDFATIIIAFDEYLSTHLFQTRTQSNPNSFR